MSTVLLLMLLASPAYDALPILKALDETLAGVSSIEYAYTAELRFGGGETQAYSGEYVADGPRAKHHIVVEDGSRRLELFAYFDGTRYSTFDSERQYLQQTTREMPELPFRFLVPLHVPLLFAATDLDDLSTGITWPPELSPLDLAPRAQRVVDAEPPELREVVFGLGPDDAEEAQIRVHFNPQCGMWPTQTQWGDENSDRYVEVRCGETAEFASGAGTVCLPVSVHFDDVHDDVTGFSFALDAASVRVNRPIDASEFEPPMDDVRFVEDLDTGIIRDLRAERRFGPTVGWPFVLIGIGGSFVALLVVGIRVVRRYSA